MFSLPSSVALRPLFGFHHRGSYLLRQSFIANSRNLVISNQVFYRIDPPWSPLSCPNRTQQVCCFSQSHRKCFWGLDSIFNKVDQERVRLAGPDRACAEWILRNGGAIKWKTSDDYLTDYNLLPTTDFHHYKIEAIDMTGADVVSLGFMHLEHLKHVKKIKLHGCRRISDETLHHLHFVKGTLQELEISWCPMITEKGLDYLIPLEKLKYVLIYGLIEINDLPPVVAELQRKMPWCKFSTEEPKEAEATEE